MLYIFLATARFRQFVWLAHVKWHADLVTVVVGILAHNQLNGSNQIQSLVK